MRVCIATGVIGASPLVNGSPLVARHSYPPQAVALLPSAGWVFSTHPRMPQRHHESRDLWIGDERAVVAARDGRADGGDGSDEHGRDRRDRRARIGKREHHHIPAALAVAGVVDRERQVATTTDRAGVSGGYGQSWRGIQWRQVTTRELLNSSGTSQND